MHQPRFCLCYQLFIAGPDLAHWRRTVTRRSLVSALVIFLASAIFGVAPVNAQPPASDPAAAPSTAAATAAQAPAGDDDARLRPLEPDFSLINLPTTLPLPLHAGNFHLTHRFNENLRNDDFTTQLSNLFGLDEGATIQFEYRFGILKHVEAIASRTNVDRNIQLSGKFDAFHQSASIPLGISAIASIEGGNNFQTRYAPAVGVVVSRTLGNFVALCASPFFVHNTLPGADQNTSFIGLGARLKIRPTVYIVGEGSPRMSGYTPGDAEYAFSIEKRVGAHVFALTFANTSATTYAQIARGGNPESLYFGFNLARKFF